MKVLQNQSRLAPSRVKFTTALCRSFVINAAGLMCALLSSLRLRCLLQSGWLSCVVARCLVVCCVLFPECGFSITNPGICISSETHADPNVEVVRVCADVTLCGIALSEKQHFLTRARWFSDVSVRFWFSEVTPPEEWRGLGVHSGPL